MEEEQLEDGDNRASFLDGIGKEHLLILWDFGDREGVLNKFLNKLGVAVAVDCDNIHTDTSSVQNQRRMTEEQREQRAFRDAVAKSMSTMSLAALLQELREVENRAFELKEKCLIATDPGALDFYERSYAAAEERIQLIQEQVDRITTRITTESNKRQQLA